VRFVTAASLFDGHDASINIMRRILQSRGAEVIHLGHDRSVHDIVDAAIEEDAHAIAVSSYQGGHMEFFTYMVERLRDRGRGDIRVFGGGGGTITDREIATLHDRGVARLYSVEDGRRLGLVGMIDDMIEHARRDIVAGLAGPPPELWTRDAAALARTLSWIEAAHATGDDPRSPRFAPKPAPARSARCSASPASAAPASHRSPTSWSAASSRPSPTAPSPCSRSTPPAAAPEARCSATASA
jgi:methylmalonyl-CoA mutase